MPRYIDADALTKRLMASPFFPNMGLHGYVVRDFVIDLIQNFPTVAIVDSEYVWQVETCVACGAIIPEGRQICPDCERKFNIKET